MNSDGRIFLLLTLLADLSQHRDFSGCDICAPIVERCTDAECRCRELLTCPEYCQIRMYIENVLIGLTDQEVDTAAYLKSQGSRSEYRAWLETLTHSRSHPVALMIH
ncbi:MAG: hypothetical protein AAB585_02025 [Patescibacteria group bacterium]